MAQPWEEYGASAPTPAPKRSVGKVRRSEDPNDPYVYDEAGNPYDPNRPPEEAEVSGELAAGPWGDYGGTGAANDYEDPLGDQSIVQQRDPVGAGSAMWSGAKSGALMGFDDEWQAGWGAAGNKLGNILGLNASTASLPEVYAALLQQRRAQKDNAFNDNPIAYGAGFLPGTLASAFALPGARAAQAETLMGRLGQVGAQGAQAGAVSGAGNAEDGFWDRMGGAAQGALVGGPMGVLSYPLSQLMSNLGGRAVQAVRRKGDPNSGLDVLAARAPQSEAAMRAKVNQFNEVGVSPRMVDVVDASGKGVLRDAASKMTPARDEVVNHAKEVAVSAQDDVADLAARVVDNNPQTARQLERQIRGDKNLGGEDEAGVLMGDVMEPLRGRTITMDDDMKAVLSTREGQAALRAAEGLMTDPAERQAARAVLAAARKAAKGPADPEDAFRAEVKGWDDMPDVMKDAYRQQRPDLAQAADPFENVTLSLDVADKFARAMRGRAANTPGLERVARDFANTVRGSARRQVPEYDEALLAYQGSQRVADAAAGTGAFEKNSNFLSTPADTYEASAGQASRAKAAALPAKRGQTQLATRPDGNIEFTYQSDGGRVTGVLKVGRGGEEAKVITMETAGGENAAGPSAMREIAEAIQAEHPALRKVSGLRVSGARRGEHSAQLPEARGVSEVNALARRARDEIVDEATKKGGQYAPGVARQLGRGRAQQRRSEALLGPDKAEQLRQGGNTLDERYYNTGYINPDAGSKTMSASQDAIVDGFADALAATTSKWSAIHTATKWLRQGGIKGVDAERLARDAISDDPARIDAAIEYLANKGMKRARAERFVKVYGANLAGRAGGQGE